ncbi:MAG TPA: hypothetical protein VKB86_02745 [Pyrinomonadaceae bacterium]|nr:hypothetical protein [Pyrinomonadaceae bacterium]
MNAKGLPVMLQGVLAGLEMAFYQNLVTNRSISQSELDGTRHNLSAVIATLKNTPEEKIEALVAQYDKYLTEHLHKFQALKSADTLSKFKHAQIIAGYVTTIMAKSGLKE